MWVWGVGGGGVVNEFQDRVGNIAFRCGHWQSVTSAMHNENLYLLPILSQSIMLRC